MHIELARRAAKRPEYTPRPWSYPGGYDSPWVRKTYAIARKEYHLTFDAIPLAEREEEYENNVFFVEGLIRDAETNECEEILRSG